MLYYNTYTRRESNQAKGAEFTKSPRILFQRIKNNLKKKLKIVRKYCTKRMEWKFFLSIRGENAHTIEYLINCLYDSSATFHIRIVRCEYITTFFCPKQLLSHAKICLGTFLLPSRYFFLSLPTILAAIKGDFLVLLLSDCSSLVRSDKKNDTEQQISQRNRLSLLHFFVILFSRLHEGGEHLCMGRRRRRRRATMESARKVVFISSSWLRPLLSFLGHRRPLPPPPPQHKSGISGEYRGEKTQHNARGKEEGSRQFLE